MPLNFASRKKQSIPEKEKISANPEIGLRIIFYKLIDIVQMLLLRAAGIEIWDSVLRFVFAEYRNSQNLYKKERFSREISKEMANTIEINFRSSLFLSRSEGAL